MDLLKQYGHKISTWQENGEGYYLKEHQFSEKEISVLLESAIVSSILSSKERKQLKKKLLATQSLSQKPANQK